MTRDRFDLLWRYLHVQDNEVAAPRPDKLWKLRWFVDFLNSPLQEGLQTTQLRLHRREYGEIQGAPWISPVLTRQTNEVGDKGVGGQ